jgi:MFS transporter, ACS family, hexuronate transporter
METQPAAVIDYERAKRVGNFRWVICALLFFATTVNYVDRSVLSVLAPTLKQQIHWSDTNYGDINAAFSAAYAVGLLIAGRLIDRFGTRWGYTVALALWSIASIAHAFVHSFNGFRMARVGLGLAEAGNFPAAVKTVAEWFPNRERSLAIGLFNSGANIGAILAPLLVPFIAQQWGWQAAFIATGTAGLIWIAFWLPIYRAPHQHRFVSKHELDHILSDPVEPTAVIPWKRLLPHRQTWAFSIAKFLTDPIWWFWLFWAPPFFADRFGLNLKTIGLPLIMIYNIGSVGSIGGGWIAGAFVRAGWSHNLSRKIALLICAICVLPVMATPAVPYKWAAVGLIGLAAAAHQGFSANLFALSGDLFPKRAVGSVVGIGGMFGAIGSIILQSSAGRIRTFTGNYVLLFIVCGSAYLIALAVIQLLAPRLARADIDAPEPRGFPVTT